MSGARFVRFYPSDWRSGCMGLSLEQEGFYIRLCSYVYETGLRLPANDSAAAKFMGLHTNAYRKIRNQLAAIGKVICREDGWTVARAEKELASALGSSAPGRQADPDAGRNTRPDTLGESPPDTPQESPMDSGVVFCEIANENNGPPLEPIAIAKVYEEDRGARASATSLFDVDEETADEFHRVCNAWGQKPGALMFGELERSVTDRLLAGEIKGVAAQHPDAPPRILHAALLTATNALTAKMLEPGDGQFKGRGTGSAASYFRQTYGSEVGRMMRAEANAEAHSRADHHVHKTNLERRVTGAPSRGSAGGWAAAMAASEA